LFGANIFDLTIDGSIISTQLLGRVGGVVGFADSSKFFNCVNYANITGEGMRSFVGGIVGEIASRSLLLYCSNHGTITGGVNTAGIVGRILGPVEAMYLFNSGTIKGNELVHLYSKTYIAGIVAEVFNGTGYPRIEYCINIGHIQSSDFDIVGGIAASCVGTISTNINAGIIDGANFYTGGIVGILLDGHIRSCINTN
jgi:hypothetical protein